MYEYKSQEDLYKAVEPALRTKMRLLHRGEYKEIKMIDIWNYLKENKWINSVDLTLAELVNDIIQVDGREIDDYCNKNI